MNKIEKFDEMAKNELGFKTHEIPEISPDVHDFFLLWLEVEYDAQLMKIHLDRTDIRKVVQTIIINRAQASRYKNNGNNKPDPNRPITKPQYEAIMKVSKQYETGINEFLKEKKIRFPTKDEVESGQTKLQNELPIISIRQASDLMDLMFGKKG